MGSSILDEIMKRPKPGDAAEWWAHEANRAPTGWSHPLEPDEINYIEVFSSPDLEPIMQFRGKVDPNQLTEEEKVKAKKRFGEDKMAFSKYANRENRRRILAHYVYHHPATVNLQLSLYRMSRDFNPITFAFERGYQIGSGKEALTNNEVSRVEAAAELVVPMLIGAAIGAVLKGTAPVSPKPKVRALTDPIYDLPVEGGGMRINGRWYTEHALERMAPDTPLIRAELTTRVVKRLERLGIKPGSVAYEKAFAKAMKKVDPRGIPPSVVEAEIAKPRSTNVKVVTAKQGSIVVSVIPR